MRKLSASFRFGAHRRGFTIVEAAVCVIIVGVMFVATMQAVGMSATMQFTATDRARARLLATALMSEILQQLYVDPGALPLFGPEAAELSAASRAAFNDVDDYHNYVDSPPRYRDGTLIPDAGAYRRSVVVEYVDLNNLAQVSIFDTGVKRITVTVERQGAVVARVVAVKTSAP